MAIKSILRLLVFLCLAVANLRAAQTTMLYETTDNTLKRPTAAQLIAANGLIGSSTIDGYFADPSTNASFSASAWWNDLSTSGSGVPLLASGVVTFTSTSGTGNFVRTTSPTIATAILTGDASFAGNLARADDGVTATLGTSADSSQYPAMELGAYNSSSDVNPLLRMYRARGTRTSPVAVQSGDYLTAWSAKGYGATGFSQHSNGSVEFLAFDTFTDSYMPTYLRVMLSPTSGGVLKNEITRIRPNGSFWVFGGNVSLNESSGLLGGLTPTLLATKQAGYSDNVVAVASNTAAERGSWIFTRARGTLNIPSAVQSGDALGGVIGAGFDGTGNMTGAGIFFATDGAVSTGVVPASISLATGTNSGTRTEALGLASSGYGKFRNRLGIGKDPSFALDVYEPTDTSARIRISNAGIGGAGTDGFELIATGSATSGQVNILQRENAPLAIWTNATQRVTVAATGEVTISSTTEATTGATGSFTTLGGIYAAKSAYFADGIIGTITNDSADAGDLGEHVSSLVASGSAVSLTTDTPANITSISLTAGDWSVGGMVNYTETSATVSARSAGISTTTATVPSDGSEGYCGVQSTLTSEKNTITLSSKRISLSATTTVYLVGSATFSAGTCSAFGNITARRVR
jgi:hypothetical protein